MFTITIAEFKTQFDRGQFNYTEETTITNYNDVRDKDITDALTESLAIINQDIYPSDNSDAIGKLALLYLTAHFLCLLIRDTDSEGQAEFPQNSRSVGSVSESVTIPEWMQQDVFATFITTSYGIKFLTITKPYLDGAVYSISGATQL